MVSLMFFPFRFHSLTFQSSAIRASAPARILYVPSSFWRSVQRTGSLRGGAGRTPKIDPCQRQQVANAAVHRHPSDRSDMGVRPTRSNADPSAFVPQAEAVPKKSILPIPTPANRREVPAHLQAVRTRSLLHPDNASISLWRAVPLLRADPGYRGPTQRAGAPVAMAQPLTRVGASPRFRRDVMKAIWNGRVHSESEDIVVVEGTATFPNRRWIAPAS